MNCPLCLSAGIGSGGLLLSGSDDGSVGVIGSQFSGAVKDRQGAVRIAVDSHDSLEVAGRYLSGSAPSCLFSKKPFPDV